MRSLLFVPADGGSKLDKAFASGADAMILDLEDSIAPDRKDTARASGAAFLKRALTAATRPRLLVRVNSIASGLIDEDLAAIVPAQPDAILLPKTEGAASLMHADAKLAAREAMAGLADGHVKILAQAIETAAGLFASGTLANASTRLIGVTWGPEDLSAEIGAETNRDAQGFLTEPYRLARSLCLFAAAAARVPAIETIYADFRNLDRLRADTEAARRDGFAGRLAIHPAQVPVINELFTPTVAALEQARAIVAAFAADPSAGVIGIGGVMYDRPHLARARTLLARSKDAGTG